MEQESRFISTSCQQISLSNDVSLDEAESIRESFFSNYSSGIGSRCFIPNQISVDQETTAEQSFKRISQSRILIASDVDQSWLENTSVQLQNGLNQFYAVDTPIQYFSSTTAKLLSIKSTEKQSYKKISNFYASKLDEDPFLLTGAKFKREQLLQKLQSLGYLPSEQIESRLSAQQIAQINSHIQQFREILPFNMVYLEHLFQSKFLLFRKLKKVKKQLQNINYRPFIVQPLEEQQVHYQLSLDRIKFQMNKFSTLFWKNLLFLSMNDCNLNNEDWRKLSENIQNFNQIQTLCLSTYLLIFMILTKLKKYAVQISICFLHHALQLVFNPLIFVSEDQLRKTMSHKKLRIELSEQNDKHEPKGNFSSVLTSEISFYSVIDMDRTDIDEQLMVKAIKINPFQQCNSGIQYNQFFSKNQNIFSEMNGVVSKINEQIFTKDLQKSKREISFNDFVQKIPDSSSLQLSTKINKNSRALQPHIFDMIKESVIQFSKFVSTSLHRFIQKLSIFIQKKYGIMIKDEICFFINNYCKNGLQIQSLSIQKQLDNFEIETIQLSNIQCASDMINSLANEQQQKSSNFYPVFQYQNFSNGYLQEKQKNRKKKLARPAIFTQKLALANHQIGKDCIQTIDMRNCETINVRKGERIKKQEQKQSEPNRRQKLAYNLEVGQCVYEKAMQLISSIFSKLSNAID